MKASKEIREKAWNILTDIEKQAIYLTLGQGLSINQSTEIIGLSKYKFMEFKKRAETLFKMFTNYYDNHKVLIRPGSITNSQCCDFIIGIIEKRLTKSEAIIYGYDSTTSGKWALKSVAETDIVNTLLELKLSKNKHDNHLYELLLEFDRWNNFRVLPKAFNRVTPFKRRKNKISDKYMESVLNMNYNSLYKIKRVYGLSKPKTEDNYYLAILSHTWLKPEIDFEILTLKKNPTTLDYLTYYNQLIFNNYLDAVEFAGIVLRRGISKSVKSSSQYWDDYNSCIAKAVNHQEIANTSIEIDYDNLFYT